MKRAALFVAILSTLVVSYSLLVRASLPQVAPNTWSTTGDMADSRAGASAVLLQDGRVLVTGGTNESGVSASVERYSPGAGGFLSTPPMEQARANHSSTLLDDGRVLVVGGIGVDGHAIASAELYDPNANVWTPAAPLNHGRSGHTASLLSDGRVLIAGGDDTGMADATLEIFDPIGSTFSQLEVALTAPRTGHAAARLADGRVLIAGGFDSVTVLASIDLYDPTSNTVSAGPSLTIARAGHSATTLLDGTVLIAGGANESSELASAEIFDASTNTIAATGNALATARQRHLAVLLPHNNNVLIVGGTSGGNAVATAELFTPWEGTGGTFCAPAVCGSGYAGPSAPAVGRAWATGSALSVPAGKTIRTGPADGLLLLAGGSATSSAADPAKSAELFGFATVKTDQEDYAPGTTVTITGSGWQPGESVALMLREYPEYDEHQLLDVQADENGNIVSTEFVPDEHDINIRFRLTAYGTSSQAQTTFRDSKPNKVIVGTQTPNPVVPGGSATYIVTVNFNNGGGSCTSPLSISSPLPVGVTASFSPNSLTSSGGNLTSTLTLTTTLGTAPTGPTGTAFTVLADTGSGCQSGTASDTGSLVIVAPSTTATTTTVASSQNPSTYGQSVSFTATVAPSSGSTAPTGTVQFVIDGVNLGSPVTLTASGSNGVATSGSTATLNVAGSAHSVTVNYAHTGSFTDSSGSLSGGQAVSKATPTITWSNPADIVYGTALGATQLNATTSVPGAFAYTPASGVVLNAGNGQGLHAAFTPTDTANYNNASKDVSINVLKADATILVTGYTGVYDAAAHGASGTATGVGGVALSGLSLGASFTNVPGGTATWTFTDGTGNYNNATGTAAIVITKKAASVTPNAASKTYGTADPSFSGTLAGFVAADGVSASYSRTAGETVAGGPYTISAVLSPAGVLTNYNVTSNTASFTINKAAASVTPNAASKTYGASDPSFSGTLSGFLAADAVTASYSRTTGETVAGGPYTISATLSPVGVLANYAITYNIANFTIDKATASVTPNAASKTYGASDPSFSGTLSGFLAADAVTASYSRTAGETVAGGPYTISATLSPVGVLANYNVTSNTASFTIDKATASVTPNAASKTYGAADPTFNGTLSGFLSADGVSATYSRTAGETVAGGPYTISATLSPVSVLANYVITSNTANFTIHKAAASVTPNAASKTYGASDPALTGTLTGFLAADSVTASYSRTAGETVAGGPYTISATLSPAGVLGNYNVTSNTASFTIDKATASVTPNAASKTYGTADPTFSGTLSGFIAADNVTANYSRTAGETVAGGPYTISATLSPAGVLANYAITSNTASFTINKAVASVTPNAASKTYGGADPSFSGTLSGFLAADGVTASYSRSAGETVAGGPSTISATLSPAAVLGNYDITYTTAAFDIIKKAATATPATANKVYGAADPSLTGALTGFLAADNVTANYSRTVGESVGAYVISATLSPAAVLGNYDITYTTAAFDITRKAASVTPAAANKVYGAADPTLTGTLNGFLEGDAVAASYSRTAGETVVGSPYSIIGALSPAGVLENYAITFNTASFTITARALTVTAAGIDRVYDGTTDATVTLADDRVAGDALTIGYTSASFADRNVGSAKPVTVTGISVTGAAAANYTSNTTASATANITARAVTVKAAASSKVYGAADPTLTGALSGFLAVDNVAANYNRTAGESVGAYVISATLSPAAVLGNYDITYSTAAFDITKKAASVTPAPANKVYGAADPTLTGAPSGFLAADNVAANYSRTAGESVGAYVISATLSPAAVLGNYNITYTTAAFDITKKAASVTPAAASKVYGASDPALSGTLNGFLAADSVTASYSRITGETVAGGPYSISATLSPADVLANYAITYNTASFTITAWNLKGFYQPVTMSSGGLVYNTIKGGSTVPLKFNVYAGAGGVEKTNVDAVHSFGLQPISCTTGIDDPLDEAFTLTGGTTLRYDSTAGQFIQNWQSPKGAGKCYAVTMTAQDNSMLVAYFKTK